MSEQIPLLENGVLCGEISCAGDGFRSVFSVDVPIWGIHGSVKKVWLTGADGSRLLLGTLMPEGGRFRLCRTLSRSTLREAGVEPPFQGEVNPEEQPGEWQSLRTFTHPDPVIRESVARISGGCWKREGDALIIRFTWRVDMPVPVTALFCLCEVRNGQMYLRVRN